MLYTTASLHDAFNDALRATRKDGVKVRQNVKSCCRGCAYAESEKYLGLAEDDETTPYAWTFGGQGNAYAWDQDMPVDAADKRSRDRYSWGRRTRAARVRRVFFYHGNGGGVVLAKHLREQGLTVDWDGDEDRAIIVVFPGVEKSY